MPTVMKNILISFLLVFICSQNLVFADTSQCNAALEVRGKSRLLVNDSKLLRRIRVCESIDTSEAKEAGSSFCSNSSSSGSKGFNFNAVIKTIPIGVGASKSKTVRNSYCDENNSFDFSSYKSNFCEFGDDIVTNNSESYDLDVNITQEQVKAYLGCLHAQKSINLSCTAQRQGDVIYFYMDWKAESSAENLKILRGADEVSKADKLNVGNHFRAIKTQTPNAVKVFASLDYKDKTYSCITDIREKKCAKPIYKEGTGAICGATYKEGSGKQCGASQYNSKAEFPCDVKKYNLSRNRNVCGSSNHTHVEPRGGCSACGGVVDKKPGLIAKTKCEEWKQAGQRACRMFYEQANECIDSAFGVASYESCENVQFGVRSWKTCRNPDFGVETFKTCRDPAFGLESCED